MAAADCLEGDFEGDLVGVVLSVVLELSADLVCSWTNLIRVVDRWMSRERKRDGWRDRQSENNTEIVRRLNRSYGMYKMQKGGEK